MKNFEAQQATFPMCSFWQGWRRSTCIALIAPLFPGASEGLPALVFSPGQGRMRWGKLRLPFTPSQSTAPLTHQLSSRSRQVAIRGETAKGKPCPPLAPSPAPPELPHASLQPLPSPVPPATPSSASSRTDS